MSVNSSRHGSDAKRGVRATPDRRRPSVEVPAPSDPHLLGAFRRSRLFGRLPAPAARRPLAGAELWDAPARTVLFARGEPAERLFLIVRGQVELFLSSRDGREAVLLVAGPEETVCETAVVGLHRYPVQARVLKAARLVAIPAPLFLAELAAEPALTRALVELMAFRVRSLARLVGELRLRSTTHRLASFLVELAGVGSGHCLVELPWKKRVLARRLGMQPETLSRAEAWLRALGVTFEHRTVHIDDLERLRRFSSTDDLSEQP